MLHSNWDTQKPDPPYWITNVYQLAATALLVALPAEALAGVASTSEDNSIQSSVVFFDLPVASADNIGPNKCTMSDEGIIVHRVVFNEDGTTSFNNTTINETYFEEEIKPRLNIDRLTELQILPDAQVETKFVVKMLDPLIAARFPCYGFVGNEQYRKIYRTKSTKPELWAAASQNQTQLPNPTPQFDPVVIHVTATDSAAREPNDPNFAGAAKIGRCRAYFGTKPVSGNELVNMVTAVMSDAVERAGGTEKFLSGEAQISDIPTGIIAASENTPWRCVGGVIFNLQVSGIIRLGFTLIPES